MYCGAVVETLVDASIFSCDVPEDQSSCEVICPLLMNLLLRLPYRAPEQGFRWPLRGADAAPHLQILPLLHFYALAGVDDWVALGQHY